MPSNHLLSHLSPDDYERIEPHLDPIALPVRTRLQARGKRVEHVYFLDSGVASVGTNGVHGIEVALIGREGMTGLSVVMGSDELAPYETRMQVAGSAHRIAADDLRDAMAASVDLHRVLLRYAHAFMTQVMEAAVAHGRCKVEQRLSRWLLMTDDRIEGDGIALTQEVLAAMIGVRRPGVTVALQEFERRGFIAHRRGFIAIIDRDGLQKTCSGTYSQNGAKLEGVLNHESARARR